MSKRGLGVSGRRRGSATLIVLLLVAVSLAVAYVSMRSQTMTLQMHSHAGLRTSAREAAMTGMAAALQTMHTSAWCNGAGVSTVLARSLGGGRRFQATYATGDASLASDDADYAEYPYRVTVDVTGYASDPANAGREIAHRLRAVVRLVPRALATEPTGWSDITGHTLCQWASGDFNITVPFRIDGPVRVRAQMDLSGDYLNWEYTHRAWYFSGLKSLYQAGQPDNRPFDGPLKLTYSAQKSETDDLLSYLGVSMQDWPTATSISWPTGALPAGYRLYPGGALYTAPALPADLRDVTLEPDPKTNPLGVFIRDGLLRVHENVSLRGTIFLNGTSGDLEIYGSNVRLHATDLPPLVDMSGASDGPVRLPTVFAQDDVRLFPGCQAEITGMVLALDRFVVENADQDSMSLVLQGKLAARNVQIERRDEWDHSSLWWGIVFNNWYAQRNDSNGIRHFPTYVQYYGPRIQPLMTMGPDSSNICYHWQNPADPLYAPDPEDVTDLDPSSPGLRWELLSWIDNPDP